LFSFFQLFLTKLFLLLHQTLFFIFLTKENNHFFRPQPQLICIFFLSHKVKIKFGLLLPVTTVPKITSTVPENDISLFCGSYLVNTYGWYFSLVFFFLFFFVVNMLILALPSLIYATTIIDFRFRNLTFLIVAVSLLDMIFFNFQSVYEQYYLFSICAASNFRLPQSTFLFFIVCI
jgi:hypothetical protein